MRTHYGLEHLIQYRNRNLNVLQPKKITQVKNNVEEELLRLKQEIDCFIE